MDYPVLSIERAFFRRLCFPIRILSFGQKPHKAITQYTLLVAAHSSFLGPCVLGYDCRLGPTSSRSGVCHALVNRL